MASSIPILEPSASLGDVNNMRQLASRSQQFMAATMIDSGRRIADEIGINAAKNEAAKLAPMLQMRYLDAYNDIAGGNTAQGLAKTMSIGAEVSSNPFLQRIAEQGNTLAAQMAQQKEIMDRTLIGEAGANARAGAANESADRRLDKGILTDLKRSEEQKLSDAQTRLTQAREANANRVRAGLPPADITPYESAVTESQSRLQEYDRKLSNLAGAPASTGFPPTAGPIINGDDGQIDFGQQNDIIGTGDEPLPTGEGGEQPATDLTGNVNQQPTAPSVTAKKAEATNPAQAPTLQQAMQPVASGSSAVFPQAIAATNSPEIGAIAGGTLVFEFRAQEELANSGEKIFEKERELLTKLEKSPEYKATETVYTLLNTRPEVAQAFAQLGGIENISLATMAEAGIGNDKEQYVLGMSADGRTEALSGPRDPATGLKTPIILTKDERDSIASLKTIIEQSRKGRELPIDGAWTPKFIVAGDVRREGQKVIKSPLDKRVFGDYAEDIKLPASEQFTKSFPNGIDPEIGDSVPPPLVQDDVAKIVSDLTGGAVTPDILANNPGMTQDIRARLWEAYDKETGGGWNAEGASKLLGMGPDKATEKIVGAAKPSIIEYLNSKKDPTTGQPIFEIKKQEKEEKLTLAKQINKRPIPNPKWMKDIEESVANFIKSESAKEEKFAKRNEILNDAVGVEIRFRKGVVEEMEYLKAMSDLRKDWESVGARSTLKEAVQKAISPEWNPFPKG